MTDLELMHHYSTITYATFPLPPHGRRIFQSEIPRIALEYPYLLHQLLAMSASHLACLHPQDKAHYHLAASIHQDRAVTGIRQGLGGEMTQESGFALFIASGLLMATTYAHHADMNEHLPNDITPVTIANMLDAFSLQRGVNTMQNTVMDRLSSDPANRLLGEPGLFTDAEDYHGLTTVKEHILHFKSRLHADSSYLEKIESEVVRGGLSDLVSAMDDYPGSKIMTGPALGVVFRWPISISDEFLRLLRNHNLGALTATLYFCVILRSAEGECWFFRGWALSMTKAISRLLLGTKWMEYARWPLRQLGQSYFEEACTPECPVT